MTPVFRRVNTVPDEYANLAYVSVSPVPADKMLSIVDPSGVKDTENRRIMYADPSGRLIDEHGDPTIQTSYPIITDVFFDKNGNKQIDAHEVIPEAAMPYVYRSKKSYVGQNSAPYYADGLSAMFSLVGTEGIRLVRTSGDEYNGNYKILLDRVGPEEVVAAGPFYGWTESKVVVLLDRDNQQLFLEFPAGRIVEAYGEYTVEAYSEGYSEEVNATELYRYTSLDEILDPDNNSKEICTTLPYGDYHSVIVQDRAFLDKRSIDPLTWRISARVKRSTQIKSTNNIDTLKVGVIGQAPPYLAAFLNSDPSYSFKMRCVNPHPVSQAGSDYWRIDETIADPWSDYDIVIYRTINIDWSHYYNAAAKVIENGGMFFIDLSGAGPIVDGSKSESEREKLVPIDMKISSTWGTVTGPEAISTYDTTPWIRDLENGYTLSEQDIIDAVPTVAFSYIDYNGEGNPKRKTLVSGYYMDADRALIAELFPGLIVSTINLTEMRSHSAKEIFCNIIWGYSIVDPERTSNSVQYESTFYSPWETSWVAGFDDNGEPILSAEEMERHSCSLVFDETTLKRKIVRTLSEKTASQLIHESVLSSGDSDYLNGADSITYELELINHNSEFVKYNKSMQSSSKPVAWSVRSDSESFNPPSGYLVKSFFENPSAGIIPSGSTDTVTTVQVVGTRSSITESEFTWSLDQAYTYSTSTTSEKDVPLTAGSGHVKLVTTKSDLDWTARYANETDLQEVRSTANLTSWGSQTAVKWYPWDGKSMLLSLGSHGDSVTYVQRALNALAEVNRGHRTGRLAVDGNYGSNTDKAVRDYQKRWGLTVDGDIDAGTAGHIMRNAGSLTSWKDLDDVWTRYGDMMNIVDGLKSTLSGRRTWVNAKVNMMIDEIFIYLNNPMKISSVEITPHMLGSGSAKNLKVFRVGGRRALNHNAYDWAINHTKNLSSAWRIYHDTTGSLKASLPNKVDALAVGLYQDSPYSGKSRHWGVRNVIFYGKVSTANTVNKSARLTHNKPLEISSVVNRTDGTTTVVTKKAHGLISGERIYVSGITDPLANGDFTVSSVVSPTSFSFMSYVGDASTSSSGSIIRHVGVKIRTGEQVVIKLRPNIKSSDTFIRWSKSATEIADDIRSSIRPTYEQDNIAVTVDIADDGELTIRFFSTTESLESDVALGNPVTIRMNGDELFGVDDDMVTGVVSSVTGSEVTDSSKFWPQGYVLEKTFTFISGVLAGKTYKVIDESNNNTVKLDGDITGCTAGDKYRISGGYCLPYKITGTCGAACTSTELSTSLTGMGEYALSGQYITFTSGINKGRYTKIVGNATNSTIEIAPVPSSIKTELPALTAPSSGDTFTITAGHWPIFASLEEDMVSSIRYRARIVDFNSSCVGVFLLVDKSGSILDVFSSITATDLQRYGYENIRIGITNLRTHGNSRTGSVDPYPKRYAMKPFCVIEKVHGCDFDVDGITGEGPSEFWGVRVESASAKKSVFIPKNLCAMADDKNRLLQYESFIMNATGKRATCVYRISSESYSDIYGAPYVDVENELVEIIDYDPTTLTGTFKTTMHPLRVDETNNATINISTTTPGYTIQSVDPDSGEVDFISVDPVSPIIRADYTYREMYVSYKGASDDIFDLCPYDGHYITIDGTTVPTSSMIGKPIYLYALPFKTIIDNTIVTRSRVLYHSCYPDMFDKNSVFYNPFALLLSIIVIRSVNESSDIVLIDTRSGGGGVKKKYESLVRTNRFRHPSGFDEIDSFFDIGHMDGLPYLIGSTVIFKLPHEWRSSWEDSGEDVSVKLSEFMTRWLPAGKSCVVMWSDGKMTSHQDIVS